MSPDPLDAPFSRWVVGITARYPDGTLRWSLMIWSISEPVDDIIGPPRTSPVWAPPAGDILHEMIDYARAHYHEVHGPAYSLDDMVITFWPFGSAEEMFHACGERLVATDAYMRNYGFTT